MNKEEKEEKEQINEGEMKERELFEESSTKGKVGRNEMKEDQSPSIRKQDKSELMMKSLDYCQLSSKLQWQTIGERDDGPGQFNDPQYVLLDLHNNHLIVCEMSNHRLQVVKADDFAHFRFIGREGSEAGEFKNSCGMEINDDGRLMVCDSVNQIVQVIDCTDDYRFVSSFNTAKIHNTLPSITITISCSFQLLKALIFIRWMAIELLRSD